MDKIVVEERSIELPARWSKTIEFNKNTARQLLVPPRKARILTGGGSAWAVADGHRWPIAAAPASAHADLIRRKDGRLAWVSGKLPDTPAKVQSSLAGAFRLPALSSSSPSHQGLRSPQIGALLAVFAHWTTGSLQPATVVMPTGTGKTDTMVAVFAAERPERLLVLVPSDVLRSQTAGKFETLGVLPELGVVSDQAKRPVVGRVGHSFESVDTARAFARACNVVVATPSALSESDESVRQAFLGPVSRIS
ncbi:DEAD/DEAH box helicase family protein [Microtetraspora niveoalba]|uniref:DEAD/DEAH box helicase family protein n=1 Tax=Microtetraspora niveoalba TaxID=46175 RepID=UPI001C3F4646|nr:DEAD/DEAH box helicase family protein [Microtetraspora niveoalba]